MSVCSLCRLCPWRSSSFISVLQNRRGVFIIKKADLGHNPHRTKPHKEPKWPLYGKSVLNLLCLSKVSSAALLFGAPQ